VIDDLTVAVAVFNELRTPAKVARALGTHGLSAARELVDSLPEAEIAEAARTSDELRSRGMESCFVGESNYPLQLLENRRAPAILFTWGNQALLNRPGLGMCGSRHVSARGISAAQTCGTEVASHDLVVISGYARGVDTETHVAALGSGGSTVIVLAEGILHFRRKQSFSGVDFDPSRISVVSQFAPGQAWNVGAAMTRNKVIVGLGKALVVIEAGETGGTLNAGLEAIKAGKPVLALEFSDDATPEGNRILHGAGAIPISGRIQLARVLDQVVQTPAQDPIDSEQLSLL
jgi:DNA processing protein